jgi:hypothetical protein
MNRAGERPVYCSNIRKYGRSVASADRGRKYGFQFVINSHAMVVPPSMTMA